jgi:hypothetical protein
MIERHWKGICKAGEAKLYEEHLKNDTFKKLTLISGFQGARLLKRDVANGTEYLVITVWDSVATIQKFSGKDITLAVVPALVQALMVSYDQRAIHYDVAGKSG